MRSVAFAALILAVAACNRGDDAQELAGSSDTLNAAQIDAALGPADQSGIQDALGAGAAAEDALANDAGNEIGNAAGANSLAVATTNETATSVEEGE